MSCNDGNVSRGERRRGAQVGSRGECNAPPRSCGDHPHGSQWWEQTGGRIREPVRCPNGGDKAEIYAEEVLMSCRDGNTSRGQTRKGSHIGSEGSCNEAPRNCGNHEHGSEWWEPTDQRMREPVHCPNGGDKAEIYQVDVQMRCNNGNVSRGGTRKGAHIGSEGSCREEQCQPGCRNVPGRGCVCENRCPSGCRPDPNSNGGCACPCNDDSSPKCPHPPGGGIQSFITGNQPRMSTK